MSIAIPRAPELLSWWASWAPRSAVLSGTAIAPSQAQPRIRSSSSIRFSHMSARRSPEPIPAALSVPAGGRGRVADLGEAALQAVEAQQRLVAVDPGLAHEQRGQRLLGERQPAQGRGADALLGGMDVHGVDDRTPRVRGSIRPAAGSARRSSPQC